jgi:hypothetical protein
MCLKDCSTRPGGVGHQEAVSPDSDLGGDLDRDCLRSLTVTGRLDHRPSHPRPSLPVTAGPRRPAAPAASRQNSTSGGRQLTRTGAAGPGVTDGHGGGQELKAKLVFKVPVGDPRAPAAGQGLLWCCCSADSEHCALNLKERLRVDAAGSWQRGVTVVLVARLCKRATSWISRRVTTVTPCRAGGSE